MKYMVGNWKMNQTKSEIETFFREVKIPAQKIYEAWIAPQAIHVTLCQSLTKEIKIGAQNCHEKDSGAFTGENSPRSLKDLGAHFTLVGHSERRAIYKENHALLNQKTIHALKTGLKVIFCVGETIDERNSGKTFDILKEQLDLGLKGITDWNNLIIAYEPVWAIGTGITASPAQAEEAHAFIKKHLQRNCVVLYGGSVKPDNVEELMNCPSIDGGLVGGASLKASDFSLLCQACAKH
jgi:triosephosphate isomerase